MNHLKEPYLSTLHKKALKKPEFGHRTSSAQLGSSSSTIQDMSSFEWAMKYQEKIRRVILYLGKTTTSVVSRGHMLSYGKVLKVDYQDEDSQAYTVQVETSKRGYDLLLSENMLVIDSCKPIELRHVLKENDNIIIAMQPFIAGYVSFADSCEETSDDQNVVTDHFNLKCGHHKEKKTKKVSNEHLRNL